MPLTLHTVLLRFGIYSQMQKAFILVLLNTSCCAAQNLKCPFKEASSFLRRWREEKRPAWWANVNTQRKTPKLGPLIIIAAAINQNILTLGIVVWQNYVCSFHLTVFVSGWSSVVIKSTPEVYFVKHFSRLSLSSPFPGKYVPSENSLNDFWVIYLSSGDISVPSANFFSLGASRSAYFIYYKVTQTF